MPQRSDESAGQSPSANINLKVADAEKWAFKTWCAQHRMTQVEAFRRAFELLKAQEAENAPRSEG